MSCTPLRLLFGSVLRDASLSTADTIVGSLGDLHNEHRSRFVQFERDETVVIEAALLADSPVDTIALAQHNLSANAVVRIEVLGFDGTVQSQKLFDQNSQLETYSLDDFVAGDVAYCGEPIHPWPDPLVDWLSEPVRPARLRITISDPQNRDGHVRLGLLMAGEYVKLTHNFSYGHNLQPLTSGALTQLKSGYSMRSQLRRKAKAWQLSLEHMPQRDQQALHEADEKAGNQPVLVSGFPDAGSNEWLERQYNFIALIDDSLSYTHTYFDNYSTLLNLREA